MSGGGGTDRRAARVLAHAQADQIRTDTAQRWKLRHSEANEARAAARRERRRQAISRAAHAVVGMGQRVLVTTPSLAGVAACVAPTMIATRGQYHFAAEVMRLGAWAVLVPLMLEGAAWLLAWQRHLAIGRGEPAGRLTSGVWVLAGTAAGLNLWHGSAGPSGSFAVGVVYGLASLVGFGLVELLARHRTANAEWTRRRRLRRRLVLARAIRFPAISWQAWSAQVAYGHTVDAEQAWQSALASVAARRKVAAVIAQVTDGTTPDRNGLEVTSSGSTCASEDRRASAECSKPAAPVVASSVPAPAPETTEAASPSVDRANAPSRVVSARDDRVAELAGLLRVDTPVTGEQAGVIFGVSDRTGRRLLDRAKRAVAAPPDADRQEFDRAVGDHSRSGSGQQRVAEEQEPAAVLRPVAPERLGASA